MKKNIVVLTLLSAGFMPFAAGAAVLVKEDHRPGVTLCVYSGINGNGQGMAQTYTLTLPEGQHCPSDVQTVDPLPGEVLVPKISG